MRNRLLLVYQDNELKKTLDGILSVEYSLHHSPEKIPGVKKLELLSPEIIIVDSELYDNISEELFLCFSIGYKLFVCGGNWPDSKQIKEYTEGMSGYCSKENIHSQIILDAVKTILKGDIWIKYHLISTVINILIQRKRANAQKLSKLNNLSNILSARELEVLRLVQTGANNKVIANKLFISERTVKAHLNSTYKKLKVNNRLNLILLLKQD